MDGKELYQADLELCKDTKCWRFAGNATKCSNCPHVKKITKVVK